MKKINLIKSIHLYLAIIITLIVVTGCCNDDPIVEPTDPCESEIETSADFGFYLKRWYLGEKYYIPIRDTFYNTTAGTGLYFKAPKNMDSYLWKIGDDPREFTDSIAYLIFEGQEGQLDVTLQTTLDEPSLDCYPNDDGFEEVTKSIYMKSLIFDLEFWPIFGKYRGANQDEPDHFFEIEYIPVDIALSNFPENCERIVGIPTEMTTPRSFEIIKSYAPDCYAPKGSAYLLDHSNDTLVIDYTMVNPDNENERLERKFIGVRIP